MGSEFQSHESVSIRSIDSVLRYSLSWCMVFALSGNYLNLALSNGQKFDYTITCMVWRMVTENEYGAESEWFYWLLMCFDQKKIENHKILGNLFEINLTIDADEHATRGAYVVRKCDEKKCCCSHRTFAILRQLKWKLWHISISSCAFPVPRPRRSTTSSYGPALSTRTQLKRKLFLSRAMEMAQRNDVNCNDATKIESHWMAVQPHRHSIESEVHALHSGGKMIRTRNRRNTDKRKMPRKTYIFYFLSTSYVFQCITHLVVIMMPF